MDLRFRRRFGAVGPRMYVVLLGLVYCKQASSQCFFNLDQQPPCCSPVTVDPSTMRRTYTTVQLAENSWDLQANFSWDRPAGNDFSGYAVLHKYGYQVSFDGLCAGTFSSYLITETEWIYLTNLRFGFYSILHIYKANITTQVKASKGENDAGEIAEIPDCYEETQSVAFCQNLAIPVAGKPINLRVDSVVIDQQLDSQAASATATVSVSWHPPAQVDNRIMIVGFRLTLIMTIAANTTSAIQPPKSVILQEPPMYDDPFSVTLRHSFPAVEVDANTGLEIWVQAVPNETCNSNSCLGNIGKLTVNISRDAVLATTTPQTEVNNTANPSDDRTALIVSLAVASTVMLVVALVAYCRCSSRKQSSRGSEINYKDDSKLSMKLDDKGKEKGIFPEKEFTRSMLVDMTEIGKGSFGVVYKAMYCKKTENKNGRYVAIKCLKSDASDKTREDFLKEIQLMIEIGSHPNIVSVIGCCTVSEPYYLITEFMEYGDLYHFLWECRKRGLEEDTEPVYHLTERCQLQIARLIARGMHYLAMNHYYHGDLAARNVLIGENLTVKIADFGLAADIYETGVGLLDSSQKRPVKWASLETLTTGRCSIESDVWSYGVVLYEIFTLGDVPYPGMNNNDVIRQLKEGYRMKQPTSCPDEIYDLMFRCWLESPSSRPTFTDVTKLIETMLARLADYLSLDEEEPTDGRPKQVVSGPSLYVVPTVKTSEKENESNYQLVDKDKLEFQRARDNDV